MSLSNTHLGPERLGQLLRDCRTVHFIGAGGVSMCSLAEIALREGLRVTGSDRTDSERLGRLRRLGADIHIGHSAEWIRGADAVIYTVAIGEENPEYLAAWQAGLPLISRADYLGYLMLRYRTRIGVAGMNGKSTTTAMCAQILLAGGDPTVLCGAELPSLGGACCRIGEGREQMVFEACEYRDSFLDFNPTLAVLLNIGMDHVDYFHSMEQLRTSFLRFAERTGPEGCVLANAEDPELMRALEPYRGRLCTFGTGRTADFRAAEVTARRGCRQFVFCRKEEPVCRISLRQPGGFQVVNALAAASAAFLSGASPQEIAQGLSSFCGVHRRMEYRGSLNGAAVYDDYAHHPTAIRATLAGARELGFRRVLCAYQPHTYSRTAGLFREFARAFDDCDRVYFADIYAARERNESGVSSRRLAEAVGRHAVYCGALPDLADRLCSDAGPGDLLLIMGAGDIEDLFGLLPLRKPQASEPDR